MTDMVCPTCKGKGSIDGAQVGVYPTAWQNATCNCGHYGQHPWDPSWCPETGPVV